MIKTLTDLKRTIQSKTPFQIVQHALYPECSGRICTVVGDDYAYQYGEPSMEEREAVGSILKTCWPRNSGYIPGCILDEAAEKLGMHLEHGCSDINF